VRRRWWVDKAPKEITRRWPEARLIAMSETVYERRYPKARVPKNESHYYLYTGPRRGRCPSPERLADLARNHWGIENRLFHRRDRTFREDDLWQKTGAVALMALRTAAITLLDLGCCPRATRTLYLPEKRQMAAAHPRRVLRWMTKQW
jgi:hypothetical protein